MTDALQFKNKGNVHYNDKDYLSAIECYTKGIEQSPEPKVLKILYTNRSQAFIKLNEFEKAIEDANLAIKLDEGFAKGYLRIATSSVHLGLLPNAEAAYREYAARVDPAACIQVQQVQKLAEDWQKCSKHYDDRQYKQSLALAKEIIQQCTHNLDLRLIFMWSCVHEKDYRLIVETSKDILDESFVRRNAKAFAEIRYCLALGLYHCVMLRECGETIEPLKKSTVADAGLNALVRALVTNVQKTFTLLQAHAGHTARKEWEKSLLPLTEALDVDPQAHMVHKFLKLRKLRPLIELRQFDQVILLATYAIEGNPFEWRREALEIRGYCYELQADYLLSTADYERANEISSSPELEQRIQYTKKQPSRKNYYHILQVERNCDESAIKKAYRELAMKYHPDRPVVNAEVAEEEQRIKKIKFQEIQEAYSVLHDPEKKLRYDAGECPDMIDVHETPDPSVVFNMHCGSLPEDATAYQAMVYRLKQCAFWSSFCVVGVATCPCWSTYLCYRQSQKAKGSRQQENKDK